jgi:predicted RNA-binding Zn ribbon-like protein
MSLTMIETTVGVEQSAAAERLMIGEERVRVRVTLRSGCALLFCASDLLLSARIPGISRN